jgi:hypothetical protein
MTLRNKLSERAREMGTDLRALRASYERDLKDATPEEADDIRKHLGRFEDQLSRVDTYHDNLALTSDGDLCPSCWIRSGIVGSVTPTDSPNDEDHYECRQCGFFETIPE